MDKTLVIGLTFQAHYTALGDDIDVSYSDWLEHLCHVIFRSHHEEYAPEMRTLNQIARDAGVSVADLQDFLAVQKF